jgi:hypothetical protein
VERGGARVAEWLQFRPWNPIHVFESIPPSSRHTASTCNSTPSDSLDRTLLPSVPCFFKFPPSTKASPHRRPLALIPTSMLGLVARGICLAFLGRGWAHPSHDPQLDISEPVLGQGKPSTRVCDTTHSEHCSEPYFFRLGRSLDSFKTCFVIPRCCSLLRRFLNYKAANCTSKNDP